MREEKCIDGMVIRPTSAYADNEPGLDPAPMSARVTAPSESLRFQGDPNTVLWWGTGGNLDLSQSAPVRKLNLKLDDLSPSPYQNPLAKLRRERKVKHGKAAKLLGISRQRLHVVEHATKPLPCMQRLVDKAMMVWPVGDGMAVTK